MGRAVYSRALDQFELMFKWETGGAMGVDDSLLRTLLVRLDQLKLSIKGKTHAE